MKKHDGKRRSLRVLCALLALCTAFSFSACDMLAGVLNGGDSSSSRPSTDEDTNISDKHSDKKDEDESESEKDTGNTDSDGEEDDGLGDTDSDGAGDIQDGAVGGDEENPIGPDFTPQTAEEKYGYQYLSSYEDGEGLCGFYADLYETAKDFASSTETVQSEKLSGLKDPYYLIGTMDYGKHGLSYEQASAVWRMVRAEYPEFYFLSNSLPYDRAEAVLYLAINEDHASYSVRAGIDFALELLVEKCASYIHEEATETEKLVFIHDFLTAELTYSFQSDGVTPSDEVWAHNIVGAAIQKEGVCETYAEAFDYLCGVFGVECLTVVGDAGTAESGYGPHAWNIVRVGEGENAKWYPIDVTWDDGYGEGWIGREWFGKVGTEYENTHIADEPIEAWGLKWQFAIPQLAENSLSPVLLCENGNEAEWCLSVDQAFEKMTNGDSRYEITLYPETQVLKNNALTVSSTKAEFITTVLPTVKSITIKGKTIFTDETKEHTYLCELTAVNPLTLTCETVLADCVLYADILITNAERYFVLEEYGDWEPI